MSKIYDLIYYGNGEEERQLALSEKQLIQDEFQDAKIDDADDDLHPCRYGVTMDIKELDDYVKYMLKTGLAARSFMVQIMVRQETQKIKSFMVKLGMMEKTSV